jgi:hypothetical protein
MNTDMKTGSARGAAQRATCLILMLTLLLVPVGCFKVKVRGPPSEEETASATERLNRAADVIQVIYTADSLFIYVEERAPKDLRELCGSPYVGVSCEDLRTPFHEDSLGESVRKGTPWLLLSKEGGSSEETKTTIKAIGGDNRKAFSTLEGVPQSFAFPRERFVSLNHAEKIGAAVEILVQELLMDRYATRHSARYPRTWEDFLSEFSGILSVLRNEFAGSHAVVSENASPGNLKIVQLEPPRETNLPQFWVEVWGANGKPIGILTVPYQAQRPR